MNIAPLADVAKQCHLVFNTALGWCVVGSAMVLAGSVRVLAAKSRQPNPRNVLASED